MIASSNDLGLFMLVIFGGIIFHMRIAPGKNKIPLHLYNTWGLRTVHGFEGGGGVVISMLFIIF